METNIVINFLDLVRKELRAALATAREREDTNAANVEFNIREVLEYLGAKSVTVKADVQKGYTWLRVRASQNGFNYALPVIGPRRQATRAEIAEATEIGNKNVYLDDAICTAGIYADDEGEHFSFKWDALVNGGEVFAFSGPVRKWNNETQAYDGPVAD